MTTAHGEKFREADNPLYSWTGRAQPGNAGAPRVRAQLRSAPRDASTLVGLALRPSTVSGSGDKAEADGGLLQAVNETSAGRE